MAAPFSVSSTMGEKKKKPSMHQVIVKVTDMISWDHAAQKLAKAAGYGIQMISWEGPCISDMTLRVNGSCMPVIRQPNFTDKTWDIKMKDIPIVIGNESSNEQERLQTISLSDYLCHFSDFMTNDVYRGNAKKGINLLSSKENGDSHVIVSSQACFLPIIKGEETKFNVALYNYQSSEKNPALLVIVSTAKGASAQIIEGRQQYLLFNHNGKNADFVGERVSDVRIQKGQENVYDKVLSKEEKQDNVIVIVQIPLKKRSIYKPPVPSYGAAPSRGGYTLPGRRSAPRRLLRGGRRGRGRGSARGGRGRGRPRGRGMPTMRPEAPKPNVEAAMVSVSDRTTPICKCKKELQKRPVKYTSDGLGVRCDGCSKMITDPETFVYHCIGRRFCNGYNLCLECGDKQLQFDELRGLLDSVKDYKLERNERYPVRVTLQYYKATDNGAVNKEIMDDIVKQLEASQKQADFMGSLVTEYDPKRPTEWIKAPKIQKEVKVDSVDKNGDEQERIRSALKKLCGSDWNTFMENFENQQVVDSDLAEIEEEDLKELIPKMGPRKRFWKWMRETQKQKKE